MRMDAKTKSRLRLWLQSEKAFGLRSVAAETGGDYSTPDQANANCLTEELAAAAKPAALLEQMEMPAFMPGSTDLKLPAADLSDFNTPVLSPDQKRQRLIAMDANEVRGCTKCRLCDCRTNTVFGEGDPDAKIFFIGEGPGETEDKTGRPFVGRAGELLNKMIAGMGLGRENVYIANIVKCRPPGNRVPAPDEVATCTPYLQRQIEIIRPKVIVTLGLPSAKYMLETKLTMGRLRGQWHSWRGIRLMPTFHPAYVLRNNTYDIRAAVWSDLKKVLGEVGLPIPQKNPAATANL